MIRNATGKVEMQSTLEHPSVEAENVLPHKSLSGTVVVTRRTHFNAAHRLENIKHSDEWNSRTYGPCNNANWHGHNYELEVSVIGTPATRSGSVIDLGDLKRIVNDYIIGKCDHRNLNMDVDFLRGIIPSAENLVIAFWNEIEPHIKGGKLYCVRLWETERNRAEYYGPNLPVPHLPL